MARVKKPGLLSHLNPLSIARNKEFAAQVVAPIRAASRREAWAPIFAGYRRLFARSSGVRDYFKRPAEIDSVAAFTAAVARFRLTPTQLDEQFRVFRRRQLVNYALAVLIFFLSLYTAAAGSLGWSLVQLPWAAAFAVRGYVAAFRAYQIRSRRLMPLAEALRDGNSYFVL